MSELKNYQKFLNTFGEEQIPLIGFADPKLTYYDDEKLILMLPLTQKTKNHLNSLYFGALAIGADLAGGLHAFFLSEKRNIETSIAFKSFNAQFLKRPESNVYFVCEQGNVVDSMLTKSIEQSKRINQVIDVTAYTHYLQNPECVAEFKLELSVKVIK